VPCAPADRLSHLERGLWVVACWESLRALKTWGSPVTLITGVSVEEDCWTCRSLSISGAVDTTNAGRSISTVGTIFADEVDSGSDGSLRAGANGPLRTLGAWGSRITIGSVSLQEDGRPEGPL
jgi:hypothetical protein